MKQTGKVALASVMSALAAAFMLTSLFPYLTYAIPAVAGLFIMITVIEIGVKWGVASYVVSSLIVLMLPGDIEAKMLYIGFFGYYPVLKAVLESKLGRVLEYIIKFAVFNVAVIAAYSLVAPLIGVDMSDMGTLGKYAAYILIAAANVVFPIYDIAVSRMYGVYMMRLHKSVSRIFYRK